MNNALRISWKFIYITQELYCSKNLKCQMIRSFGKIFDQCVSHESTQCWAGDKHNIALLRCWSVLSSGSRHITEKKQQISKFFVKLVRRTQEDTLLYISTIQVLQGPSYVTSQSSLVIMLRRFVIVGVRNLRTMVHF